MIALLININSKQRYIFGSNKLKLNIGASHIISDVIFKKLIGEIIDQEFQVSLDLENWNKLPISNGNSVNIGYIGGGNALLLFKDDNHVKKFVYGFSKRILAEYEGVLPQFATEQFDPEDSNFEEIKVNLNKQLNLNRSLHHNTLPFFKHGIDDDCPYTNASAAFAHKEGDNTQYISREACIKINMCQEAQTEVASKYKDALNGQFVFTDNIDDLVSESTKRYIAVVHIDGNGMGKMFMKTTTLENHRELSHKVNQLLHHSLDELVQYVVNLFEKSEEEENVMVCKLDKTIKLKRGGEIEGFTLPMRPIINAGDDITFVCHGKLAIHLAEKYMEILSSKAIGGKKLQFSAGVAIYHVKFPFFKIYQVAEELTSEAKVEARKKEARATDTELGQSNFIKFFISSNNQSYKQEKGKFATYELGEGKSFEDLKSLSETLRGWSKTTLGKHREMLFRSENEKEEWKLHLRLKYNGLDTTRLFCPEVYDAIELIDFYPFK